MRPSTLLRRLLVWLRPRRRFPPTREGWWFLMATLLIGLAAINAGLNLLFLVWGMMLCLILASGVLSELCLRQLEVRRSPPTNIHARAPYLMGIALTNNKRRVPSFSVEVEDLMDGRPIEKRCYFLKLPAGRTQETAYRHVMPRRGRQQLSGLRLSTKFPFGLIQKSRDVTDPAELIIYPALVPVPEPLLRGLPAEHGRGRMRWRSRGGDFFGLRDFRHGDDPRDIHWRTTARRGMPFVRENEDDEGLTATVLLDNAGDGGSAEAFEEAVSLAASVAAELLVRGYRVAFVARGLHIAGARGPGQNTRIMRALALIAPAAADGELPSATGPCIRIRPGKAPEATGGRGPAAAGPPARERSA
ncbi:MAG TPA: DUF58 domain-containing protein [Polyangia bacterium]|nr:DUF58 domain-containing protein [Polyangia bacterium]